MFLCHLAFFFFYLKRTIFQISAVYIRQPWLIITYKIHTNVKRFMSCNSRVRVSHLITGRTSRFESLSMVATTEDLPVLVEVDKIHQQLVTHAAHKALWVPAHPVARTWRKDGNVTSVYLSPTLKMWES